MRDQADEQNTEQPQMYMQCQKNLAAGPLSLEIGHYIQAQLFKLPHFKCLHIAIYAAGSSWICAAKMPF